MFEKLIGNITVTIGKLYARTFIAKWFAKRAAAMKAKVVIKDTKDVVADVIAEARQRAADAMAGHGVYATYTDDERQAEFDAMIDRVLQMTEMQTKLKQDAEDK